MHYQCTLTLSSGAKRGWVRVSVSRSRFNLATGKSDRYECLVQYHTRQAGLAALPALLAAAQLVQAGAHA